MLAEKEGSDLRGFFSLSKGMTRQVSLPQAKGKKCFSSQGWLITIDVWGKLFLVESSGALLLVSQEGVQLWPAKEGIDKWIFSNLFPESVEPCLKNSSYGTTGFKVFEVNLGGGEWKE
ncbi:hypothetical protein CFP56_022661 [Quercus suber]|uniref:Uncharacterized protein n=1 Tax=Quercus suber TaxID=58331 RepID=A0AAW0LZK2_QUESU